VPQVLALDRARPTNYNCYRAHRRSLVGSIKWASTDHVPILVAPHCKRPDGKPASGNPGPALGKARARAPRHLKCRIRHDACIGHEIIAGYRSRVPATSPFLSFLNHATVSSPLCPHLVPHPIRLTARPCRSSEDHAR
jgi:hypothetical protein